MGEKRRVQPWPYAAKQCRDQAVEHLAAAEKEIEEVLRTEISPDEGREAQLLGQVACRIHDGLLNLQSIGGPYRPN